MIELLGVGFLAGIIAGISPCVIPVLPVLLVAGATSDTSGSSKLRRRALAVVAGLIVSFTVFTLAGSALLSALGLPQDLLRDAGLALLGLIGLGLLIPSLGELIARPFARVRIPTLSGRSSGFVLGIGLGAVFVPCAGPVLTAITVIAATRRVGAESTLLTIAFSFGAAVPLLVIALAGGELTSRVRALRQHGSAVRAVGGVALIAMTIVLATNVADGLQRSVPGYTSALQSSIEGSSTTAHRLSALSAQPHSAQGPTTVNPQASCMANSAILRDCGEAPPFAGISQWLNTKDGRPITIRQLRGKVVLVDFWTYSCINCQRSLPHVEAWYARYHADGFEVIGVHTPEFAFEHVVSNVRAAAAQLGVHYPIAIDNNYDTWDAYSNDAWPADYLIDPNGEIRYFSFGEGDYSTTETLIRQLLVQQHPTLRLPPRTDVANKTPTEATSPETYLGFQRDQFLYATIAQSRPKVYAYPSVLPFGDFAIKGTWTVNSQEITADSTDALEYPITARDVYLVLGGHGRLTVSVNGKVTKMLAIGGIPRLYTLASSPTTLNATIGLAFTPGIQAYDFTFG